MTSSADNAGGVVCFGNFIVDHIHTLDYWPTRGNLARILKQDMGMGGGAANVAADLQSLGLDGSVAAAGALGDDADGAFICSELVRRGVDVSGMVSFPGRATSHTHVMNLPGEGRTFFYHGGAGDHGTETMVDAAAYAARGYRFFYLGYLMLMPSLDRIGPDGRTGASHILESARRAGLTTVVDFVSSEDPGFGEQVGASLPHCDYLVVNETEAGRATGIDVRSPDGALDRAALEEAAQRLITADVRQAVVIHAPEAALWLEKDKAPLIVPSVKINADRIVSAVGAGDAFCAGVIYGLHAGWEPLKIMTMAHRVAASSLPGKTATDGIPAMHDLLAG